MNRSKPTYRIYTHGINIMVTVISNKNCKDIDIIYTDFNKKKARLMRSNTELVNTLHKNKVNMPDIDKVMDFVDRRIRELRGWASNT